MPFTLAHPAAVLPLMRRPFVALALVCGAMAPDIPYFIRAARIPVSAQSWYEPFTNATTSHSLHGLLYVTMPLALLLYLLLLAAAPPLRWLTGRSGAVPRPGHGAARVLGWLWVLVSLLIGALTHLLWDSATDSGGFLATRFEVLNQVAVAGLTWTRVLQHGSTVLGLTIIAVVLWRRRNSLRLEADVRRRSLWALVGLLAACLVGGVTTMLLTLDLSSEISLENILSALAKGGGAAGVVALALATASWWMWRLSTRRRAPGLGAADASGPEF